MQLISLHIYRLGYGETKLRGEIQFGSESTKTSLNLTEQQAARIVTLVSDQVVDSAKDLSKALKQDVFEHLNLPQLEAPKG